MGFSTRASQSRMNFSICIVIYRAYTLDMHVIQHMFKPLSHFSSLITNGNSGGVVVGEPTTTTGPFDIVRTTTTVHCLTVLAYCLCTPDTVIDIR